jgi:hypothetical protein
VNQTNIYVPETKNFMKYLGRDKSLGAGKTARIWQKLGLK